MKVLREKIDTDYTRIYKHGTREKRMFSGYLILYCSRLVYIYNTIHNGMFLSKHVNQVIVKDSIRWSKIKLDPVYLA